VPDLIFFAAFMMPRPPRHIDARLLRHCSIEGSIFSILAGAAGSAVPHGAAALPSRSRDSFATPLPPTVLLPSFERPQEEIHERPPSPDARAQRLMLFAPVFERHVAGMQQRQRSVDILSVTARPNDKTTTDVHAMITLSMSMKMVASGKVMPRR